MARAAARVSAEHMHKGQRGKGAEQTRGISLSGRHHSGAA